MTTVSGSAFEFSLESTGGIWRWKVTSQNVSGAGVFYEVSDIETPWGPLFQTAIPLPSDVVQSMSAAISDIQQQLAPLLALLDPSGTSFVIVITEGDPNLVAAEVPFFNAGAFGSSLTATASPGAAWLRADPGQVGSLGKNDQGLFTVTLLTGSLVAAATPYLGVVNLQDNRVPSTLIPIAFSVSVLPRPIVATDVTSVDFSWYQMTSSGDGPFAVSVSNSGPPNSLLNWAAARLLNASPWLSFTPSSGGPLASSASQAVSLALVSSMIPSTPGTYVDKVRFSSPNAVNGFVDVSVTLTVISP
jgi:hypothetical protein